VRVLIADDHAISRSGLEFLLSGEPDMEIVGTATDGEQVLALAAELNPDIVILDLILPRKPGLLVLDQLCRFNPRPKVIALSGQASGLAFKQACDIGADAVISKEDPSENLLLALAALQRGEKFRSPKVAKLVGVLEASGVDPALTQREREILALIAAGDSDQQIAGHLGISPKTAKKHRENIRTKLGVSNAVEAARVAARLGLEPVD